MEWFWNAMWGYLGLLAAPFVFFAILMALVAVLALVATITDFVRGLFKAK